MLRLIPPLVLIIVAAGCGRTVPYRYKLDGGTVVDLIELPEEDGGMPQLCVPLESDTFTLPPMKRRPIDVLFVIDDSASMKNDQEALANNFKSFISSFTAQDVDFHLGTVTTDMVKASRKGRLVVPFLTPQTANLSTAFSTMVNVGTDGNSNEQGIAAAHAALSEPLLSGANKGFLRPEADLGIVFLADEDDHATETVSSFVNFLKALKPDVNAMSVASIVGLQSGLLCGVSNWRYVQVARAFGPRGLVSTCDPQYAQTLAAVSGRLINSRCFIGLKRMLEEQMRVRVLVNGVESLYRRVAPDSIYPNGSIELLICPEAGGLVELRYEECS